MTTLTVYDPPMCCATGVCGPEVDPALVQFAGDLDWLKTHGIEVQRLNLAQQPARFAEHAAVKALLDRSGVDGLPAIVVGDQLVANARYPNRDELAAMTGVASAPAAVEITAQISELIALGAAIGASCEPCLKFHYGAARKLGVSEAAMREAVGIGERVKGGSTKSIMGLADRLLGTAQPAAPAASCCGSATAQSVEPTSKKCC
jgi:AhpD family alkylhydroperoxidase